MAVRRTGQWGPRRACCTALGLSALLVTVLGWSDTAPSTTTAASDARTSQSTADDASSTIWLTNVDADRVADVAIELLREDGSPTSPLTWTDLAPFASTRLALAADPAVSGGAYAARVRTSGGRLGVVAYTDGPGWGASASNAVDAASTDLVLGYWTRNFYGQSGHVTLFNPGNASADDIAIEWHKDLDPGAPVVTTRLALAPGAVRTIDLASPEAGVDVGDDSRGWARVRSSVPLAVYGSLAPSGELAISAGVEAVPAASAARRWHVPLVYWNWWDGVSMYIESMTFVVNPGSAPVQVTQTLQGLTDDCRGVQKVDVPYDVPAQGAIMLAARPLPGRCAGSERIDATGDVIVTALVNSGEHRTLGLYAPQPLADASPHAVLPARRGVGLARRTTEFHVLNPGSAVVNAVLTLRNADGTIVPCGAACTFDAASGAAVRFDLAGIGDLPDGFDGSVWIDGDGPLHTVAYERNAAAPADGAVFRAVDTEAHAGGDQRLLVPRVVRAVPPTSTPTSSPTSTATATEPPTETPTATQPSTNTPTPAPTITPEAYITPTIMPVPTARIPFGPDMAMDLLGLIGSYAAEAIPERNSGPSNLGFAVVEDGRGVVSVMDGRLNIFDLDGGPTLMGSLVIPRELVYDRRLVLSGPRALLLGGLHVTFLDLTRRDAPRFVRTDELGATVEHVDFEGDRLYLASHGDANRPPTVWLYDVAVPNDIRRIGETVLDGRLVGLQASGLRVAATIAVPQPRAGVTVPPHLRLFDATDPAALQLINHSDTEVPPVIDFEGDRLLVLAPWMTEFSDMPAVCLVDVTALPVVPQRSCLRTTSGRVLDARFEGRDIRVVASAVKTGEVGPVVVSLLQTNGAQIVAPIETNTFPNSSMASYGGGATCYDGQGPTRRGESGFWCRDRAGRTLYMPHPDAEPELEPENLDDVVVAAFRIAGIDFALTSSYALPLGVRAGGGLRAVGRLPVPAPEMASGQFAELAGRTLFRDANGAVFDVREQDGALLLEPTGWSADWLAIVDNDFILLTYGFPTAIVRVDGATLAERGRVVLPVRTRRSAPVLDGTRLYVLSTPRAWVEVDLSDPTQPQIGRTLPDFAPRGFAAVDGVAFVPEPSSRGDAGDDIVLIDLRAAVPTPIGRLDLDGVAPSRAAAVVQHMFVAGEVLYLDVGGGWAARIDVRTPRAPRRIGAQLFPDDALRFEAVGTRVAVISSGWLTFSTPDVDLGSPSDAPWRPWRRRPWAPIAVVDDVLIVDQAEPWLYDVRSPSQPRRTAALVGATARGLAKAGRRIAAPVRGGSGVRLWELTDDYVPVLVGEWCLPVGACSGSPGGEAIETLAASGATIFAVTDHGLLIALDTTDPTRIQRLAAVRAEAVAAYKSELIGSRLIVFQANGYAPFQFDVADARRPRPIGPMHGLPVTSHHGRSGPSTLVLADGRNVLFVDFSDLDRPQVMDALWFGDSVRGIAVVNDRAVVLAEGMLWTVDVLAGRPPNVMGKIGVAVPWSEDRIAARGDVVYYGNTWRRGIEVLGRSRIVGKLQRLFLPEALQPMR